MIEPVPSGAGGTPTLLCSQFRPAHDIHGLLEPRVVYGRDIDDNHLFEMRIRFDPFAASEIGKNMHAGLCDSNIPRLNLRFVQGVDPHSGSDVFRLPAILFAQSPR